MKTFKLFIEARLDAENAGDAARRISEHFAAVAARWADDDDAADDTMPQTFRPPSNIQLWPEDD